jgi:hypothetical protein
VRVRKNPTVPQAVVQWALQLFETLPGGQYDGALAEETRTVAEAKHTDRERQRCEIMSFLGVEYSEGPLPIPPTKADMLELLREHSGTVRSALLYRVLDNAVLQSPAVVDRLLGLAPLVLPQPRMPKSASAGAAHRLSPMASKYLQRATRLHLWGFEPEAVIMCRSVLEAALVARLSAVIKLDEPPPQLEVLSRTAGQLKLLPGYMEASNRRGWKAVRDSPLWDAERIRWTSNHLLHEVPELDPDVDGLPDSATAVKTLAALLDRLYPAEEAA